MRPIAPDTLFRNGFGDEWDRTSAEALAEREGWRAF